MKFLTTFLITFQFLSLLNSVAQSSTQTKLDSKFGFRDVTLESSFNVIRQKYSLTKKYSTGIIDAYDLKGANMFIDDIPIEFIVLEFIGDELYTIHLQIASDRSTSRLTALIEASYGKLKEDTESHDYFVRGNKTELIYQVRGTQMANGYIKTFASLTLRSLKLKRKLYGHDNGF